VASAYENRNQRKHPGGEASAENDISNLKCEKPAAWRIERNENQYESDSSAQCIKPAVAKNKSASLKWRESSMASMAARRGVNVSAKAGGAEISLLAAWRKAFEMARLAKAGWRNQP